MRLLIVNPSAVRGGAEQMLSTFARDFPAHGIVARIACLKPGPFVDELRGEGANVTLVDAGRMRQAHRWVATVGRLARLAREADVVCSWQVKGHYYGTPAARLAGKPALWWDHGIRPVAPEPGAFAAGTIPRALHADLVLTSSHASAARHDNAIAIHPGIDAAAFTRASNCAGVRASFGVHSDEMLVGIVGRLQPWKGQHVFLRAAASVRNPRTRFVVIGDAIGGFSSGYPAELRALARSLGIEDRVIFAGERRDVASLLPALDLFVHASTDEPFGIVLIEAMAAGVPVVATRGGGVPEIVIDEENGLLVPPADADAMAACIDRLLGNPALRSTLSGAATARVLRDFTVERMVADFAAAVRRFAPSTLAVGA